MQSIWIRLKRQKQIAMNSESRIKINFSRLGGPTYIGRPNGQLAREKLNLDELEDKEGAEFLIDIPEDTFNINSSYFLGLFGDSVRKAGTRELFLSKFKFETHGKTYKVIERGIKRALMRNKELYLGD